MKREMEADTVYRSMELVLTSGLHGMKGGRRKQESVLLIGSLQGLLSGSIPSFRANR